MNHKRKKPQLADAKLWVRQHGKYLTALAVIIVAFIGFGSIFLTDKIEQTVTRTNPSGSGTISTPQLVLETSPLTGREVSPELTQKPVTAVIIENSPEARPQSGLADAGVVYEVIAEGGITRFAAFYQEEVPAVIGPVRSLRPYFNDFIMQFDASVAHVGGSPRATAEIGALGIKDLDEFRYAGTYWRDTSRFAPHNTYTSAENIASLQSQLGHTQSDFTILPRKSASPLSEPTSTNITVNISSFLYNPVFTYNKAQNNYARSVAGSPHKDRETSEQLSPDVVVVLQMSHQVIDDVGHLAITSTGSNTAWVFQDGGVTKGSWERTGRSGQISLLDETGESLAINPGQVWFSILPSGNSVNY